MIKALIIEDNLVFIKNILNTTINRINNIHITHIATNVKEALKIVNDNCFDLIFLDLKLPDGNGLDIVKQIKYSSNIKQPNIIILSAYQDLVPHDFENYHIISIIGKLEKKEIIYEKLLQSVNQMDFTNLENNIKEIIISKLTKIGYNWKYQGTVYILESIMYIYRHNNIDLLDNIEQNVYKPISCIHKKSVNNIKTSIIKSTNSIKNNDINLIEITPKFVISSILTELNSKSSYFDMK